ncbi:MAG: V4R domain-containing protein [Myxococcota bacterium]
MKEIKTPPRIDTSSTDLGFDPNAVLVKKSSLMLEPAFLDALSAELEEDLGVEATPLALVQIGLLHGLRDAMRVVAETFSTLLGSRAAPLAPALALRFLPQRSSETPGTIEMRGTWPGRRESVARLARTGTCEEPSCFLSAGYTSGWLSGTLNTEILALEVTCSSAGHDACRFEAREAEVWRARGDPRTAQLLEALPFPAFRSLVQSDLELQECDSDGFDPDAPTVHIWGPVMVIPYAGADEAMRAIEMIGQNGGARDVSVVVLDLTGMFVDEAFGALALERIVETVDAWGAETIFAGLSPLSAPVVDDLDHKPLFVHKDIEHAIASAFQISEARRNLA